jgi:hypothetical protein
MNEIWANRLVAGTKLWSEVPSVRRNGVKAVLAGRVAAGTVTAEEYEAITGEAYQAKEE